MLVINHLHVRSLQQHCRDTHHYSHIPFQPNILTLAHRNTENKVAKPLTPKQIALMKYRLQQNKTIVAEPLGSPHEFAINGKTCSVLVREMVGRCETMMALNVILNVEKLDSHLNRKR